MEKRAICLILMSIFLFSIFIIPSISSKKIEKINSNVLSALENKEKVKVIIQASDSVGKGKEIFNGIYAAEMTKDEIEQLASDSDVKQISLDQVKHIFLQNSTVIVNATRAWKVQIANTNLTGAGQTVCIIDTGVNSSHPDLSGKVLGGWDFVNNDNDSSDDNGHGTHVAGIIAANGTIKGVAPDAKLVMIKSCDSSGSCSDSNIISGINWCVGNSSLYNISVISISLGGGEFDNYCDTGSESAFAAPINSAVAKNITVVVASGNYDSANGYTNFTKIASPACIQNATAVTATDISDNIATSYAKRNSLVKLAAPGSSINSTNISKGSYELMSGTSMAAPHVAAAVAILQQARKLQLNKSYTPDEVVSLLQAKGKQINDSVSGLNYSRINIYASIDTTAPFYYNVTNSAAYKNYFNITWTDDTNISTVIAEFNGTNYTGSNISQAGSVFSLNKTFSVGNYTLKWYANDTFGNSNQTDSYNVTIIQANPNLNLTLNVSGIIYSQSINVNNNTAVNISLTSSGEGNIFLYQNSSLINSGTAKISNTSAYYTGIYTIKGNYSETQNYTYNEITYVIIVESPNQTPVSYKVSPLNNTYSSAANITFKINATDATLKNATLYLWNSTSLISTNMTNITGIYNETNWTYSLSEGNYSWNAQACDNSSNCNWTESNFTLTADRTNPSISVSISDTSIQTSESTTITCSSTDTNLANLTIYIDGSTKNSSSSLASISYVYSPSSSGTKTVNCTAYDKASNANSTASSISVSSPSSGSSSGSSSSDESGGGTATETSAVSYSIVYDIMPADEKVTIEPTKSVINLTGVEKFSVTSSIQAASVEFRIASVENSTQKIDDAYKYFSISASNLADSYITEAEIAFKVEKSWIKDGNYDEDTVKLNRYHDGEWAALDTNLTDESSAYYEYRAATPGFSTFAITAEKLPVAISNITTTATGAGANETAKTGTEKATRNIILYLAIIAAIAIAIAVTIIILSKPKDHGKFHPKA